MRPRSGGSVSRRSSSCSQAGPVERGLPCSLARQHHCHRLQPLEREFLRLAQVGAVQLAVPRAIGAPVQSPTPVACTLFVCSEATMLTAKGEGRGCLHPNRIPEQDSTCSGILSRSVRHLGSGRHGSVQTERSLVLCMRGKQAQMWLMGSKERRSSPITLKFVSGK